MLVKVHKVHKVIRETLNRNTGAQGSPGTGGGTGAQGVDGAQGSQDSGVIKLYLPLEQECYSNKHQHQLVDKRTTGVDDRALKL